MSVGGAGLGVLNEPCPQPSSGAASARQRPRAIPTRITCFKVAARRSRATRRDCAQPGAVRARARFCHTRAPGRGTVTESAADSLGRPELGAHCTSAVPDAELYSPTQEVGLMVVE